MLATIGVVTLDDGAFLDRLGQHDALLVVGQTGEDLIGATVEQAHEGDPFLAVVLKLHHVGVKLCRAGGDDLRGSHLGLSFLLLVLGGDEYAGARSVAIDGAALATRAPSLDVELIYEVLRDIVRQVDRHADRVVDPALDAALHLHLLHPIHVVRCGLIIRGVRDHVIDLG